jgi:hypothetical protein
MDETSITAAGAIDTFLVLLIGIGPKIALVPFVEITAPLDPATKRRVLRKMLTTAAAVAVLLMVLGELLRGLLHFSIGSLSIAGGVILLVLAVWMVLSPPDGSSHSTAGKDPMQLALFPLAVPYLLNPVGIVGLMTISAEANTYELRSPPPGVDKAPLPQPSALTTPIGHDTSVPWSGQYPYGFLASDRYRWCQRYLPEVGFAAADTNSEPILQPASGPSEPGRAGCRKQRIRCRPPPAPSMEVMR